MAQIEWHPSEWSDEGEMAYLNGIELDVHPSIFDEGQWAWDVKPSSARCEFPELYDCGTSKTMDEAKSKAETSARKADASYQHIKYS